MEVNLGRRKTGYQGKREYIEKHLENGRSLRKSNDYPLKCEVKLNRVWKNSKHNIETTRRNRQRMEQEGTLPSSISTEPSHYNEHWQTYPAIIPAGGITRKGYVKEVWVEVRGYSKSIQIGSQSHEVEVIDPVAHNTEKWIQGFRVGIDVFLLPSPKIVVKYYRESE